MKEIEFWFSIGSTYTYLSVSRLKEVERKFEVSFSWQPFSVRKIMHEMDNVPFPPTKQAKVDYMWGTFSGGQAAMDLRLEFLPLIR